MAQEISWSVSSRTAGIFGSFVWSTNESILEQQKVHLKKISYYIFKESLWVGFATNQLQKYQKNGISVKVI